MKSVAHCFVFLEEVGIIVERRMTSLHGFRKYLKWTPAKEKMHRIALPNFQHI